MTDFHTDLTNLTDSASLRPCLSAVPPTRNERRMRRLPVYRHKGVQLAAYCSRMANASATMRFSWDCLWPLRAANTFREICVRVIHWLYENREYNLHEYFWCVCPVRLWSAIRNKRKNRRDKSFGYTSGSYRALCIGKAIAPSTIMCRKIYSKANCTHIIT